MVMVILILIIFGLCLGSFVNALVWRLHEQAEATETASPGTGDRSPGKRRRRAAQQATDHGSQETVDLSIMHGRSMCPNCHHVLAAKDLVPVFSWLSLKGKCRYCRAAISWQYPIVELLVTILFIVSYLLWPVALEGQGLFDFVMWLGFIVAFMALAVYDLRWFLLPDRVVYPLMGLAGLQVIAAATIYNGGWPTILTAVWGVICIAGLFFVLHVASKGTWIGAGDVKLAVVLGLLVGGPLSGLLLIFIASLLGTLAALPLIARGKASAHSHIPFGPFLLLATAVVVLLGGSITDWYTGLVVGS